MDAHDQWFVENILPLEGALTSYLRRVGSRVGDAEDLRQEVYVRVYEAARRLRPAAANHFLFAVARNLVRDRIRHSRVVCIDFVADLEALNVLSEEVPQDRILSGREELARLQRAMDSLPARCRQVFWLRKVEGLSQRETASRLGVSVSTIEKQVAKAMRILANSFFDGETAAQLNVLGDGEEDRRDEAGS